MIRVNQEIAEFKNLPNEFRKNGYFVVSKDDYAFVVSSEEFPKPFQNAQKETKKYELFLSALLHGNEVGGIQVLNHFAKKIITDKIKIPHSFFFCLGNIEAAQKGVRFIERDLNRSFLAPSTELLEEKLAVRISNYVKDCAYCIDIHQTNQDAVTPFMIFIYTSEKMNFSRHMDAQIPVIVSVEERHKDGSTLDFYCYKHNIISTTLELGKTGFHEKQADFGVAYLSNFLTLPDLHKEEPFKNVYRVADTIYWFDDRIALHPGYNNFSMIKKGEVLGKKGEADYPSPYDGVMLFPKYGDIALKTKEVFTIAQSVLSFEDLKKPKDAK
ncbi:MAG: succinylglutamate desuccinylase/aspartoacylase family protein [Bdellovibrionota bacterium]